MVFNKAKENGCRMCPKVFCCAKCRDAHESNKHPKPKCLLCVKHRLPLNPVQEKNQFDLSHVIFNHLPLRCKLCGDVFKNSQDLTSTKPCSWWSQKSEAEKQQTPPQSTKLITCNNNLGNIDSSNSSSALNVVNHSSSIIINPQLHKSCTSHLQPGQANFDSPPTELVRHTSTPVHPAIAPSSPKQANGSAGIPQFLLSKTPTSFEKRATFEASDPAAGENSSPELPALGTRFYSSTASIVHFGLSARDNYDGKSVNQSEVESSYNSLSILKKHLDPTSSEVVPRQESRVHDSTEKRVRFSDECLMPGPDDSANDSAYFADNDIFFEARENLDDSTTTTATTDAAVAQPLVCSCCNSKEGALTSPVSGNGRNGDCCNNNNNDENHAKKLQAGAADENKPGATTASTTSTSRVVMMLVVEQTDSKSFSSLDLRPLIDSGLKKLEEQGNFGDGRSCGNNDENRECSCSSNSSSSSGQTTTIRHSTELSNFSRKVDTEKVYSKGKSSRRTSIRDSCVSIHDRVEEESTEAVGNEVQQQQQTTRQHLIDQSDSENLVVGKSDGIFSMVARVVRSALNKLPVQVINQAITCSVPAPLAAVAPPKNLPPEPVLQEQQQQQQPPLQQQQLDNSSFCSDFSILGSPTTSGPQLSSTRCIPLVRSTLKRPRDRLDGGEELAYSTPSHSPGDYGSSSSGGGGSSGGSECDVLSPSLKRYRGRYRVRARQPIARMRERRLLGSPRGASLETQRFQQGSLTVGDTLLPLPSRAHQSTQTEYTQ